MNFIYYSFILIIHLFQSFIINWFIINWFNIIN